MDWIRITSSIAGVRIGVLGISAPLQVRFLAHLHQIVTELSQKSQNVAVA